MDGYILTIWFVRLLFLALLYAFLFGIVRVLLRDLRAAGRTRAELGRLVVLQSPRGEPLVGAAFPLDAIASIGRDVNNAIVVDDPYASAVHATLTFRGRSWFVEDMGSTNGTFLNGSQVDRLAPFGFGDELQVGEVRFRLDRGRDDGARG